MLRHVGDSAVGSGGMVSPVEWQTSREPKELECWSLRRNLDARDRCRLDRFESRSRMLHQDQDVCSSSLGALWSYLASKLFLGGYYSIPSTAVWMPGIHWSLSWSGTVFYLFIQDGWSGLGTWPKLVSEVQSLGNANGLVSYSLVLGPWGQLED